MKKFNLTVLFLVLITLVFSQNSKNDNIKNIVNEITKNCNNLKYGNDSLKAIENISLYREYYDSKAYKDALPHWQYLLVNAPNTYTRNICAL